MTDVASLQMERDRLRAEVEALKKDVDFWRRLCQEAIREGHRAMEISRRWQDIAEGKS